jgi:hypothetical protein
MYCGDTDTWAWKWCTNNDDNLESWGVYLRRVPLINITIAGDQITATKKGAHCRK